MAIKSISDISAENFIVDKKAFSKSYFLKKNPALLSTQIIKKLKSNSQGKNIRICVHAKKNCNLHQMIICQYKKFSHPAKKHKERDKAYLVLEGKLQVSFFLKERNRIIKKVCILTKQNKVPLFIPSNTIHHDIPLTNSAIYIEMLGGSFKSKRSDRIEYNKIH